jgi:GNAT superfamily N-acetyltransferase
VESLESKVNGFLHANAAGRKVNEECGPFHIGFDPDTDLVYLNYAVPEPGAAPTPSDIAALVAAFEARGRVPRLEFAPGGAPLVEPALLAAGFSVQERLPFMLIGVGDLAPAKDVAGVEVLALSASSTDEELYGVCRAQAEAFSDLDSDRDLAGAVAGLRSLLENGGGAVLARGAIGTPDAGRPMGGGSFSIPRGGTTEAGGIGVREAFRRRGVGAAVTRALTQEAFDRGVECVWLTPAGADQERLYGTVGFRSLGEMLFIWKK